MQKRQLIINDYKTAEDGLFTLTACKITKAAQEQNFVKVPGRFAPLNLSTVLTDGQPYYGSASLSAVLESSEGTRAERQERIDHLVNLLDGYTAKIIHPDFPGKYMVGCVEVVPDFNGLAYCSVKLSATLEPWLYNDEETEHTTTVPSGRVGKNLFDTTVSVGNSGVYNGYLVNDPNSKWYSRIDIDTLPDVFTLSTKVICDNYGASADTTLRIYFYDADQKSLSPIKIGTQATAQNPITTVTVNKADVPIGTRYVEFMIRINSAGYNTDTQLELGSIATEYEPPVTAASAGGSNLLDIPDTTVSGSHAYSNVEVGDFELTPGDYTFSAQYAHKGLQKGQISIREYGTLDGYLNTATLQPGTSGKAVVRFTVPEGVQGIRIYLYSNVSATPGNTSVTISDIMVNEGNTALDYEPFYVLADQLLTLTNEGRLAVVPVVGVVGSVTLTFDDKTHALGTGTSQLPDLYLTPGKKHVVCSGSGTVAVTYREAVLAG